MSLYVSSKSFTVLLMVLYAEVYLFISVQFWTDSDCPKSIYIIQHTTKICMHNTSPLKINFTVLVVILTLYYYIKLPFYIQI